MRYDSPTAIADEMRPYLQCGIIQGHFPRKLNGQVVSMSGLGIESCGTIRDSAFAAADRKLTALIPDVGSRKAYLENEFNKAEQFLRKAGLAGELTVTERPVSTECENN